jgi:hypothetical protein
LPAIGRRFGCGIPQFGNCLVFRRHGRGQKFVGKLYDVLPGNFIFVDEEVLFIVLDFFVFRGKRVSLCHGLYALRYQILLAGSQNDG